MPIPVKKRVRAPKISVPALARDVAEIKGDLLRLSVLLGQHFGPAFEKEVKDIVEQKQGA